MFSLKYCNFHEKSFFQVTVSINQNGADPQIYKSDAPGEIGDILQVFHWHLDGMLVSYLQKFFSRKYFICNVSAYQTQILLILSLVARSANIFKGEMVIRQ